MMMNAIRKLEARDVIIKNKKNGIRMKPQNRSENCCAAMHQFFAVLKKIYL